MDEHSNVRPEFDKRPLTPLSAVANAVRGGLIGLAELVPGISGGTIALIVGVYERLIDSGNHIITGIKRLIVGPDRSTWLTEVKKAHWALIIPLLIGMVLTVFTMAGVMETFVTDHAILARALFLGMVAASVAVPILLIDRADLSSGADIGRALGVLLPVAILFFFLTGMGESAVNSDPSKLLVFAAAAIAVCALVLPGVSGSFFLLTIGIYAPTVTAVSDRDLGYLAVFMMGALVGLALFVKFLHYLLHNHHTLVMLAMAGLMLGSLRALWPWQGESKELLAPGDQVGPAAGLMVLGATIVITLVYIDRRLSSTTDHTEPPQAPHGAGRH